ncbi:hypothetical protein SAMN02745146_0863 [Hymenobacter daecheongensis DSM 21074]|uniref:Uncharacterized protein n=1 Tax=Hymenobacter daecheongensis DSM 21074 TaxID=1121955 RepID=A0A1M6B3L3_9BACT|nr:hypothetical protein SAMN02745146_0863 [Hymenobacter daecheongensis DSM 21074]
MYQGLLPYALSYLSTYQAFTISALKEFKPLFRRLFEPLFV